MFAVGSDVRGELHYTLRLELASAWTSDKLQERLGQYDLGPCQPIHQQKLTYFVAAGLAYWLPAAAAGRILVICTPADMPGVIANGQEPIALPRDAQRLIAATDRQRLFTTLLQVKFLEGAGQKLVAGEPQQTHDLVAALAWLWGQDVTAALELTLGSRFFYRTANGGHFECQATSSSQAVG